MRRNLPALCLFFVLVAPAAAVSAQEIDPAADLQARGLFDAGEGAYAAGRFEEAYSYFQRAYELSHRPALLYNLGLAAASAGHEREAIAAFESYLAEVPDAPNHSIAEARIASMRVELAEEEAVAARLAAAEDATLRDAARARDQRAASSGAQRDAGWALVISGGVLLITGAVLTGVGFADIASVEGAAEGTPWPSLNDAATRAPILTGLGMALGATGLAALGIGLGLALSATTEPDAAASPSARFSPVIDPASGIFGLSVHGTF